MSEGKTLSEALKEIYSSMEPDIKEYLSEMTVSCKKGCAWCCHLLVVCTFTEGIFIAEEFLLRRQDPKEWIKKISAAAKKMMYKDITSANWFEKRIPCVFLDLSDNSCCIYDHRPEPCRYHYAVTPAENCSPDSPNGSKLAFVDLNKAREKIWEFHEYVSKEANIASAMGPLPLMVIWGMEFILRQDPLHEFLKQEMKGLPDPIEWLREYSSCLKNQERQRKASEEEIKQFLTHP